MLISFSKGRAYKYFISSGMTGFDGDGPTFAHKLIRDFLKKAGIFDPFLVAETSKTITFHPVEGPKKVRPRKGGWWNDWGLDNPGLNKFLLDFGDRVKEKENFILSLAGKDKDHVSTIIAATCAKFPNILAVEYNASCPNNSSVRVGANEVIRMSEFLKKKFDIDIIVKVGSHSNHYKQIAMGTKGLIKAFRINSVPVKSGGAISGKLAQETNWRIMEELLEASSTPVIAPSIWEYEDMKKVLAMGASGIDFGSVSMVHPLRPWGPAIPFLWSKKHKKEQEERERYFKSCARIKSSK